MSLSNESIEKLVDNIAQDVFHIIKQNPLYKEGVMNPLPSAIQEVIGDTSPELIGELGSRIMDRIGVECYPDAEIWKNRYETLYRYVKRTFPNDYIEGIEYGDYVTMYGDFNDAVELD